MLKTYSIKGNNNIVTFSLKTAVSNFTFTAEFKGGDAYGFAGKPKRSTYKTTKSMEQYAIESSEMFERGIITLDSSVDTPAEVKAKAAAAARRQQAEQRAEQDEKELEEVMGISADKKTKKK